MVEHSPRNKTNKFHGVQVNGSGVNERSLLFWIVPVNNVSYRRRRQGKGKVKRCMEVQLSIIYFVGTGRGSTIGLPSSSVS